MTHVLGDNKEEIMNEKNIEFENYEIASQPERKTIGQVSNAKKLRLRRKPNEKAEIVCLLNEGDEVTIITNKSTHEFYKVVLSSGVEGFCMKKFITLK